ncbi:MAG: hypothetical protein Q8K74_07530 [Candidatus Nitrotoga sp.]|nr:hypothetical protein [Candidatus Nitrotoga sp.]RFC40452.1 MAG: hypothetical protein DID89_2727546902 [Candidatus Nitrotoga sp. CP45]MDO9447668.1 hypothetical protein [Candidatus Nitrotoga sp.]MDP1637807.1 hypothetical protein [Candidatus Nitrotoga sp.]MDP1855882.1 hypothetical protein [Candidatus Nitrotoga sp.]
MDHSVLMLDVLYWSYRIPKYGWITKNTNKLPGGFNAEVQCL